jgi:hypothetical protein
LLFYTFLIKSQGNLFNGIGIKEVLSESEKFGLSAQRA